jgi:uracil-DNA glycosylase family 4
VGITGGEEEEVRGEPLVGPSGRRLVRPLTLYSKAEGLKECLPIYKYNLMNCRCIEVGYGGYVINRKNSPTVREMRDCCERWLFPELAKTKAKIILLLGTVVYKFMMKNRFDVFGKAIGHRLYTPKCTSTGLPKVVYSYGEKYETET